LVLRKALPPIIPQTSNNNNNNNNNSNNNDPGSSNEGLLITRNDEIIEEDFLSEPIGEILDEYSFLTTTTPTTILSNDNPSTITNCVHNFVLTIADGKSKKVSEYHASVERLALFFIENADTVNVANTDGGYWKILYIWKKDVDGNGNDDNNDNDNDDKKKKHKYSLVGYFTLFHFIALFHKPEPGLIIRICQALVLPPFQGQGHGKRLLEAVNNLAHQNQEKKDNDDIIHRTIVQINVEDPAPAFVALRNKVDWKLILENYQEWNWPSKGTISSSSDDNELSLFFTALTEREASEMSTKAKITPKQIHIMNDLLKLQALSSFCDKNEDDKKAKAERCFRLMIKRRLNKEYRDELIGLPTKEDQKLMLGKLFDEELKQYERILRSTSTPI
jgi:histone acetyltransferase 1